jgi:hypothetical protein
MQNNSQPVVRIEGRLTSVADINSDEQQRIGALRGGMTTGIRQR